LETNGQTPQQYKIIKLKVLKKNDPYPDADIAILTVEKVNQRTNSFQINPICMPQNEKTEAGRNCFVIGYGHSKTQGENTNILMEAKLPIIDIQICKEKYEQINMTLSDGQQKLPKFNSTSTICAGYENGDQDACQNDSGGPLMCQRASSCEWYLAGVVSFGYKCGETYGLYTNINLFADWIHKEAGIQKSDVEKKECKIKYGHSGCEALKFDGKLYQQDKGSTSYTLQHPILPLETLFPYEGSLILKKGHKPSSGAGPQSETIALFTIDNDHVCLFDTREQFYFKHEKLEITGDRIECASQAEVNALLTSQSKGQSDKCSSELLGAVIVNHAKNESYDLKVDTTKNGKNFISDNGITFYHEIYNGIGYWFLGTNYVLSKCYKQGSSKDCIENLSDVGWTCVDRSINWAENQRVSITVKEKCICEEKTVISIPGWQSTSFKRINDGTYKETGIGELEIVLAQNMWIVKRQQDPLSSLICYHLNAGKTRLEDISRLTCVQDATWYFHNISPQKIPCNC